MLIPHLTPLHSYTLHLFLFSTDKYTADACQERMNTRIKANQKVEEQTTLKFET